MQKFLILSLSAVLCGSFVAAQQVGCQATTSSVVGSYTYAATEVPLNGVTMTPPGTNSNTSIGKLVRAINSGNAFSSSGVLYFDGAGNISVGISSSTLGAATNVGTYTVNTDCTINVSLTDAFSAASNPSTAKLVGFVLSGGTEVDLSAPQSSTSTLVTGQFASLLSLQLIRSFAYGCNANSLFGAYGFVGTGYAQVTAAGSTAAQPVTFLARLHFDGNGNVVSDPVTSPSPLASLQYVGTYTVNLDCSGSMSLSPVPASATSGTSASTVALTVNFALTPASVYLTNGGSLTISGNAARAGVQFTLSTATETISGYGRAQ